MTSSSFIKYLLFYGEKDIHMFRNMLTGWIDVVMYMEHGMLRWTIAPSSEIYGVVNEEYERRKEQISPENKA